MSGNLYSQRDSISVRSRDLSVAEGGIRVIVGLEVAGLLLAAVGFMSTSYVSGDLVATAPSLFLLAINIALMAYAAPKLWRFEPRGFRLMYWILGLQLICILGPRISYANYYPFIAWVGFLKQGANAQIFGLGFEGTTMLRITTHPTEMPNALAINLAAIVLISLLKKLRIQRERTLAVQKQIKSAESSTQPTTDIG